MLTQSVCPEGSELGCAQRSGRGLGTASPFELTNEGVSAIFTLKRKPTYAEVSGTSIDDTTLITPAKPKYKTSSVVLIANMRQIIIRIAELPSPNPTEKWDLVKSAFPIGRRMNETTHIFDGEIFKSKNSATPGRFFMIAIPREMSETITSNAATLFRTPMALDRLDTVENIIFRHYISLSLTENTLILLPQGGGLRLLLITDSLPNTTTYVSNHPDTRQTEILRWLTSTQDHPIKKAVLLTRGNADEWNWLHLFFTDYGIMMEEEDYNLRNFLGVK